MNPLNALYDQGMRPVVRSLPSQPHWKRLAEYTKTSGGKDGQSFAIHFTHVISSPPGDTLYFAFCASLSYSDAMARLAFIDSLFSQPQAQLSFGCWTRSPAAAAVANDAFGAAAADSRKAAVHVAAARVAALEANTGTRNWRAAAELAEAAAEGAAECLPPRRPVGIYYRRELLTYSVEGRRIDLITISGASGVGSPEAPLDAPLLPDGNVRPGRFTRKRTILMTARVHPGEVPASFVVDGLLQFLFREDDPRALRLRANFVFKIIPMLNPDGVYEGKYRADTLGVNLNRVYGRATHEAHPSVYAALAVARQIHERRELFAYVDAHAHAAKRGCFFYGNVLQKDKFGNTLAADDPDFVDGVLFARLVSINSPHLDFDQCLFYAGDSRHGNRHGSGREAVYAATALPLIYTLECNYNSGKRTNQLPPRFEGTVEPRTLSPRPPDVRRVSLKGRKATQPPYGPNTWRDVGKAIALAAIDYVGVNPASRCGQSPESGCEELRKPLREWLRLHTAVAAAPGAADSDEDDAEDDDGINRSVDLTSNASFLGASESSSTGSTESVATLRQSIRELAASMLYDSNY